MSSVAPLTDRQELTLAFAAALGYPHEPPAPAARACAEVSRARSAEAAGLLEAFAALAEAESLGTLQEEYTRAFDLDTMSRSEPTCYPYVGHYLFEESHKRGAFILGLLQRYRAAGFEDDSDLPDHLLVLLRFLSVCSDDELSDELVDDAILPALARMTLLGAEGEERASTGRNAWLGVLRALELSLAADRPPRSELDQQEVEAEREWARAQDSLGIERIRCGH